MFIQQSTTAMIIAVTECILFRDEQDHVIFRSQRSKRSPNDHQISDITNHDLFLISKMDLDWKDQKNGAKS